MSLPAQKPPCNRHLAIATKGSRANQLFSCQMRMRLVLMLVKVPWGIVTVAALAISTRGFWAASWTQPGSNLISA